MTGDEKFLMFRNRLSKVYRHVSKIARKQNVSCYRIYNHDLPEFPFSIDIYGNKLYVNEYKRRHQLSDAAHEQWLQKSMTVIAEVLQLPVENIYLKLRQRKAGRQGQYQKMEAEENEHIVSENNLQFIVNLSNYLDTGLFLDHRITRKMVQEQSSTKRVLNLFAYTGSFSVYAAAGGAVQVTTVDLSKTYLNWAAKNMQRNAFEGAGYEYIHADVLQLLPTLASNSYDLIVMDPPTFSNSKRMEDFLDIQKNHVALINDCLRIVAPGGIVYFSTNYTRFQLDAHALHTHLVKDITKATTPFDFEGKLQRWCYKITKPSTEA